MTKKHFEAIAAMLGDLRDWPDSTIDFDRGFRRALDMVAGRLADQFEDENPRFDRAKFLDVARTDGVG